MFSRIFHLKNNLKKNYNFTKCFQRTLFKNAANRVNLDEGIRGDSCNYIENMYNLWRRDRKLVEASWDDYFSSLEVGEYKERAQYSKKEPIEDSMKVLLLIRAYQRNGYLSADLDPLGLDLQNVATQTFPVFECRSTLDYKSYGFTEEDLDKEFTIFTSQISGIMSEKNPVKLKDILAHLNRAYCSTIGADYMFISSREECNFMREKFENEWANYDYTKNKEKRLETFDRLCWAVYFEEFLQNKFTTHKRFGLEGLESLISGLKWYVDESVKKFGVSDITLGMAHRGRLNVLANIMRKPMNQIFAEFQGKIKIDDNNDKEVNYIQSGDVKYHLGTHHERSYKDGKIASLDILPNPSHLEAVNPVVVGKVRAKQHFSKDNERKENLAVLIHGDASFAGQGVVYETCQMANLADYTTGGVLHVIANNQIGFTTTPRDGRSTPYVTDLMKAYESPIIHVNADDPVAVDFCFSVAAEYRHKFKKDIAIDIIGYRKYGHNELDQPLFTQPMMYHAIQKQKNVLQKYEKSLIDLKVLTEEEANKIKGNVKSLIEQYYNAAEQNVFEESQWISKQWRGLCNKTYSAPKTTGVSIDLLRQYNEMTNIIPKDFNPHSQIAKIYETRYKSIKEGTNIDWGTAEALSWASLLNEGYTVRISGQDVQRGTFSHRHSVLHDQVKDVAYIPLNNIIGNENHNFQPCNSHLSEFAVLGFELGFSYYNPDALVIWEAQFGDFNNGAQIIIDQFIASGEKKWNTQNGLVMLLPHGMDGQGPEHSSARIERFLEMMDDEEDDLSVFDEPNKITQIQESNWQVCNPTTSSNYFHLLRRQMKRNFRKPLIVASPKKLLRHKMANSNIEEFKEGTFFIKVRPETNINVMNNTKNVSTILICSGQISTDLIQQRDKLQRADIAIVIVEQIGPFPYVDFLQAIEPFSNVKNFLWVQEEHRNQGCWTYVKPRIQNLLKFAKKPSELHYVGRRASCSAATGLHSIFEKEHKEILEKAFRI